MSQEPIHTRLSKPRELLAEVQELVDGFVGIVVDALFGGAGTQDVGQHRCVADFLVGHVFDEEAVFGCQAGFFEVFDGEAREAIMEEVEFNVFLVQSESLHSLAFILGYHVRWRWRTNDSKSKSLFALYTGVVPFVPTPPAGVYGAGWGECNLPSLG